ncbi:MAG: hypothetical protein RR537_01540 [Longicatena sp.]
MVTYIFMIIIVLCALDIVFYLKKINTLLNEQFTKKETTKDK